MAENGKKKETDPTDSNEDAEAKLEAEPIDLGDPLPDRSKKIGDAPYDPTQDRERKRGQIALLLIWTLVGVIVASFLIFGIKILQCPECGDETTGLAVMVDALSELLELIFAPLIGLIGAVTGFYFGAKSR